jgi:hypothetical protein
MDFYNPYGNYGAMNYRNGYPPASVQPIMQQPVQQTQPTSPDWVMSPTLKQVEQISVQPGQKAWIMVQNEPIFALRYADNMGLVTTDYYRFEKFDPNAAAPSAPETAYITRDDLEKRLSEFAESLKPTKGKKEANNE